MRMHNPGLIKSFEADGAIAGRRIVQFSTNGAVKQGVDSTHALLGVSERVGASDGAMCDVILSGAAEVVYGGNVAHGDPLTCDSQGRAVKANPSSGVTAHVLGLAMVDGASGDHGSVLISNHSIKG